jgi:hypothetical protein
LQIRIQLPKIKWFRACRIRTCNHAEFRAKNPHTLLTGSGLLDKCIAMTKNDTYIAHKRQPFSSKLIFKFISPHLECLYM